MKVLVIARMTFLEAARQPAGLILTLMLAILMLAAPAYSHFSLAVDRSADLLRTNLLSTHILGGVVFTSLVSTSLFYREISSRTILSLLTKPVSLAEYYLGKLLGIIGTLAVFYIIMTTIGIITINIGVKETASTQINLMVLYMLVGGLAGMLLLVFVLNYLFNINIVSACFIGWVPLSALVLLLSHWLSPVMGLPLVERGMLVEYLKCSVVLSGLLAVMASLSVACSSFTGPVLNLLLSVGFLLLGLMAPGLTDALGSSQAQFLSAAQALPDLHIFWLAEMITIRHPIPLNYVVESLGYAALLIAAFSCAGVYALSARDYS